MEPLKFPEVDVETVGLDAYCSGVPRSRCPYAFGSENCKAWLRGWDEAAKICREDDADWTDEAELLSALDDPLGLHP
jgi:ribosome modulation factor